MKMSLGIVVHANHRRRFADALDTVSGAELKWILYRDDSEVADAVHQALAQDRLDGLLLGLMPYQMCRSVIPADLPVEITVPTQSDLVIALHRAAARGWGYGPFSVDTFDRQTVREVSAAIESRSEAIGCIPFTPEESVDAIVHKHQNFLERHPGSFVITARTGVYRRLAGVTRVLNPMTLPSSLRFTLHNLATRIRTRQQEALRLAAGIFVIAAPRRGVDVERARAGLMHLLLSTPELSNAWIEQRGRGGIVTIGHRAMFEKLTGNWQTLSLLGQAEAALRLRIAAGFGIGSSARTCVRLAEQAAHRSEGEAVPCGYLVEERGLIVGPMAPAATTLEFTYREHGQALESLARQVGLSSATLSRIAAVERTAGGDLLSAREMATALGVTDPSGRRLLHRLHVHGLATADGSAQENRRGRPTTLYRLRVTDAIGANSPPSL